MPNQDDGPSVVNRKYDLVHIIREAELKRWTPALDCVCSPPTNSTVQLQGRTIPELREQELVQEKEGTLEIP